MPSRKAFSPLASAAWKANIASASAVNRAALLRPRRRSFNRLVFVECILESISEQNIHAQADNGLVLDSLAWSIRVGDASARIEYVLEIRLQLAPGGKLILISGFHVCLATLHRVEGACVKGSVPVQPGRMTAHLGVTHPHTTAIVVPMHDRLMESKTSVHAHINYIAVLLGRSHSTDKEIYGPVAVLILGVAPNHLIGHRIDGVIAAMGCRNAGALRVRQ